MRHSRQADPADRKDQGVIQGKESSLPDVRLDNLVPVIDRLFLLFDHTPPTSNHAFTVNKYIHRIVPTTEAKKYMAWAKEETERQAERWQWRGSWVRLMFQLTTQTKTRPDLSNAKKVIEDGIAKGLKVDDTWFLWTDLVPTIDRTRPSHIEITITQDMRQGVFDGI